MVDFDVEVLVEVELWLWAEEGFELYFLEGELLLGQIGDYDFLGLAEVEDEGPGYSYQLAPHCLQGQSELLLDLLVRIDNLFLLGWQLPHLFFNHLEIFAKVFVVGVTGIEALILFVNVVYDFDVSEGFFVEIDVCDHTSMASEVFLTQLNEHLLVGFVGTDAALETEDCVRKVSEQTVAEGSQFSEVVREFVAEWSLLAPSVAIQLHVFLVILRNFDFVELDVLFVVQNEFFVAFLELFEVFDDVLEV